MSYCSQLEQWASDIGTAVATMAAYARAVGLAADTHTREVCIPPEAPHYVHAARNIVLDATTKMQREVIEPEEYLQTLAIDVCLLPFVPNPGIASMRTWLIA